MPSISANMRVAFWIIAAVASVVFGLLGNDLAISVIYFFTRGRRGRPPKNRPFYIWAIFFISFLSSISFSTLAAFSPSKFDEPIQRKYLGSVLSISGEPIQGGKVTVTLQNMSQSTFTDSQGNYQFNIPSDSVLLAHISITAEDFQFYSEDIYLDPNSETIKNIRLFPLAVDTAVITPTRQKTEQPPNATEPIFSATISCDVIQVNLRMSPGYRDKDDITDVVVKIDCGQEVELLGENQVVDELTWWNVSWNGYTGWVADHTGSGTPILIFDK